MIGVGYDLPPDQLEALEAAMWAGDTDALDALAPCGCCCHEHTFQCCPARLWGGCRGQGSVEPDHEAWAKFYAETRGMNEDEFFGIGEHGRFDDADDHDI